jgi:hypothetical protein
MRARRCADRRRPAGARPRRRGLFRAGQRANAPHHPLAGGRRAADEEDGVVAGDGAEQVGPAFGVEGVGDRLGAARDRVDDQQLADPIDTVEQLRQQRVERRAADVGRVVGETG